MKKVAKKIARRVSKAIPPLYRTINRYRGWRLHDADLKQDYIKVGGSGGEFDYGAWVVPTGLLHPNSIVYSVGIGDDTTFDEELMRRFDCTVYGFDPVPLATNHVRSANLGPKFIFEPIGLSSRDGEDRFQTPKIAGGSFLKSSGAAGTGTQAFAVRRLKTIMDMLQHDHIDVLKMDIEGFEYEVIDDMLACNILPKCILLEFHHKQRKDPQSTHDAVQKLKQAGYGNFWISELGAEYGFILVENS